MSNPVHSSTANAPGGSLPARYPRTATLLSVVGLFVGSTGLLYATTLAVGEGFAVTAFVASSWLLSVLMVALAVRPYVHRLGTRTRSVPEGLDASVEAICARNGVAVRRSWMVPDAPGARLAEITGLLPWNRHFVVDEWFFASLSPAEREALAAREAALVRARYQLCSHVAGPAVVAAVAALLAAAVHIRPGAVAGANAVVAFGVACTGMYWRAARRGVEKLYAADRHAARQTSREAVVGLLEQTERESDESVWHRWPLSVLMMRPTTERRIEQLKRGRTSAD